MPRSKAARMTPSDRADLNAASVLFSANPAHAPHFAHFLKARERILEETAAFGAAWTQRRSQAMQAALEAGSRIAAGGVQDPGAAGQAFADWQQGAMARLSDDAADWATLMTRCATCLIDNEIEAVEETVDGAERAAKPTYAMPV